MRSRYVMLPAMRGSSPTRCALPGREIRSRAAVLIAPVPPGRDNVLKWPLDLQHTLQRLFAARRTWRAEASCMAGMPKISFPRAGRGVVPERTGGAMTRHRTSLLLTLLLVGCASAPRGPSDGELGQQLEQRFQAAAEAEAFVGLFANDGRLTVTGFPQASGSVADIDAIGVDQIRTFVTQTGRPPGFAATFERFERSGPEATHTGRWTMQGGQGGTLALTWRQAQDGEWRIALLRIAFGATPPQPR